MRYAEIIAEAPGASPVLTPILVIVHPDSACGSADFHLGDEAKRARGRLVGEIARWNGGVVVITGENSRELSRNGMLDSALQTAIGKATVAGLPAVRTSGPDPKQIEVIRRVAKRLKIASNTPIIVTGAWASSGSSGCVNSVKEALDGLSYTEVSISPNALVEPDDEGTA